MTDELAQPSQHPVMMLYWIAVVGAYGRVEKGTSMWQRKKELEISSSLENRCLISSYLFMPHRLSHPLSPCKAYSLTIP